MIYVVCPDELGISGGQKKLYRHVDVLNQGGFEAAALHEQAGFSYTWFDHTTTVTHAGQVRITPADHLVMPEVYGPGLAEMWPGTTKVVLNQNAYFTFSGYSMAVADRMSPYRHPDVAATLTVSEDSLAYLRYAFPDHRFLRIRYSVDPDLFFAGTAKKDQICFMPRRNAEDARQVINILKMRDALGGFAVVPIDGMTEKQTAEVLRESRIFISFSGAEGFGLPPAEAMAAGCLTIGYHGRGGREFFRPDLSYPIPHGDVIAFARTVEEVIAQLRRDPGAFDARTSAAADFIAGAYSPVAESSSILDCWNEILSTTADRTLSTPGGDWT